MDLRYIRNFNSISKDTQLRINSSTILVIGAGGLGGFVLDSLSRLGVKKIKIVDFDTFDFSNLNRQLLSNESNIGHFKVYEAKKYITSVNSLVEVEVFCNKFEECDFNFIFDGIDIVFDCCDSIKTKLLIEEKCIFFKIPLIYGSVGGFFGQVAYINPLKPLLKKIYPESQNFGIEKELGNLCFVVSIIASLQISLFIKNIFDNSNINTGFYYIDIESFEIQWISLKF